jgi:hypothetical protein
MGDNDDRLHKMYASQHYDNGVEVMPDHSRTGPARRNSDNPRLEADPELWARMTKGTGIATLNARQSQMTARLRKIIAWCFRRHIHQEYAFFRGCDPAIEVHMVRIRAVLNRPELATEEDAPWIESMEHTITIISNR